MQKVVHCLSHTCSKEPVLLHSTAVNSEAKCHVKYFFNLNALDTRVLSSMNQGTRLLNVTTSEETFL